MKLSALVAACHDASCRPPTSGGTGGSGKGGRTGQTVSAASSRHFQRRSESDVNPMPEAAATALVRAKDGTGRRILDKNITVPEGKVVGVRANLNVKKSTGITVQTMHDGTEAQLRKGTGLFGGEAIGYGAVVQLNDVQFSVNQQAREKIATGQSNKFPMASVDGHTTATTADRFDGVELRFNPAREHLFVDPDGRPVRSVSEATVTGSRVFARGDITYWGPDDMPKPAGDHPTAARPVD